MPGSGTSTRLHGAGLFVDRRHGDDPRVDLDRAIERAADGTGGAVDLYERGRNLLEEEDRTGGGQRRVPIRDLFDLGHSFPYSLHGGLRAPAEGMPAKTRRERPLVRGGWAHR